MLSKKVSVSDLDHLTWGDVLKLNALLDMQEDQQAAYHELMTDRSKKKG